MWRPVRIACGVLALVGIAFIVRHILREREAFDAWQRELSVNKVSELPPLDATIAQLYESPPPPGRRVRLSSRAHVRDTILTRRPISGIERTIWQPEGLVFLHDSLTGQRFALLTRLDVRGPGWVELMPMPRDVRTRSTVSRWTPLAHLAEMWMPGWAEANGPGGFVWLGMDSAVIRYRDLAGPPYDPPYRLRPVVVAGRPGGPEPPVIFSRSVLLGGSILIVLGLFALFGGRWPR